MKTSRYQDWQDYTYAHREVEPEEITFVDRLEKAAEMRAKAEKPPLTIENLRKFLKCRHLTNEDYEYYREHHAEVMEYHAECPV